MKILLIIFHVLFVSVVFGQAKALWIQKGDQFYTNQDYANALDMYQKAMDDSTILQTAVIPYEIQLTNQKFGFQKKDTKVNSNDYVRHQLAMCQLYTFDYKRAEDHLEITKEIPAYELDHFYYAKALKNNGKFQQAIEEYTHVINNDYASDSIKVLAQIAIEGCNYGKFEGRIFPGVTVELLGESFNKGTSSFAVQYFGSEDKVIFTSAREGGVILNKEQESAFLCDVYWMEKEEDGEWKEAVNFGRPFNSAQHDAAASFNGNNVLFHTRWSDVNRKGKSLYLGRMIENKFFESYKLDERVNVTGYSSMQPFVTKDGTTLFFSSNRPGGSGGYDIWKISLDQEGNLLGEAENLSDVINSPADEVAPFYHEKYSTFYFSSNGINSIGGYDIFKAEYNEEKNLFSTVENLGEPINSTKDDLYIIWDNKLEEGYLSSDREDCEFGHCMKVYKVKNGRLIVELEGYTLDLKTEEKLANATLTFKDVLGVQENMTVQTDENGYYLKRLQISEEWFIKASKPKYFNDANVVNTKSITNSTRLRLDFKLDKIPPGEIKIEGIEYDFNASTLRPESMLVLDKLYDFLELNDSLIIELNAHTDSRGSDKYNLNLSQRRAQSCVTYLIQKGMDPGRVKAKGYGESKPGVYFFNGEAQLDEDGSKVILTETFINQFKITDKEKFEELHQSNRRTAIKVVGGDKEYESDNQ